MMGIIRNIGEIINRPIIGGFYLYLVLLWILNLADIFQTLMLKRGGHLKEEANIFMDFFLSVDGRLFILSKVLALVLITAMVLRGYYDKKGTTIGGTYYRSEDMRRAIVFLLAGGVIYYLIIVLIPFIAILINAFIHET